MAGGRFPLRSGRESGAAPTKEVLRTTNAPAKKPPDQVNRTKRGIKWYSATLFDHIVERYHDVHRRDLPELVRLARRVEAVHRDHSLAPSGLADALEAILENLLDHMTKEERILFPAIRNGFAGSLVGPIAVMRHEHDHHGEEVRAMEALAHDFKPPEDACNSWRALYAGLDKFTRDLVEHIYLENDVLFPGFERTRAGA